MVLVAVGGRGIPVRKTGPIMAVPKPINLPSRRAENHGFDPNIQLVPGGTQWGPSAGAKPPAGNTQNASPSAAAAQKSEAAESSPSTSTRAPWAAQQQPTVIPPRAVPASSADFPKLGISSPGVAPASSPPGLNLSPRIGCFLCQRVILNRFLSFVLDIGSRWSKCSDGQQIPAVGSLAPKPTNLQ